MQFSHFFWGAIFGSFLCALQSNFIIGCQTQIVSLSEQESSFTVVAFILFSRHSDRFLLSLFCDALPCLAFFVCKFTNESMGIIKHSILYYYLAFWYCNCNSFISILIHAPAKRAPKLCTTLRCTTEYSYRSIHNLGQNREQGAHYDILNTVFQEEWFWLQFITSCSFGLFVPSLRFARSLLDYHQHARARGAQVVKGNIWLRSSLLWARSRLCHLSLGLPGIAYYQHIV